MVSGSNKRKEIDCMVPGSDNNKSGSGSNNKQSGTTPTNANVESIVSENVMASNDVGIENATTGSKSPNWRRNKPLRRRTSDIWQHSTVVQDEVKMDDKAVMKPMAKCNYCKAKFSADSKFDMTHVGSHYKTHIVNLIARDGLKMIGKAANNICSTITIIKSSWQ